MIATIQQAADEQQRIDTLERSLMSQLLALGHSLLGVFLAKQGDGDQGETVPAEGGPTLKRLPQPHQRRYLSVFGEHTITRFVYFYCNRFCVTSARARSIMGPRGGNAAYSEGS